MDGKIKQKWEFGDFQTPDELALKAVSSLYNLGIRPKSIIEPTCGEGSFIIAATKVFKEAEIFAGIDINIEYLKRLKKELARTGKGGGVSLIAGDFFSLDLERMVKSMKEPVLILGNPPWVTSAGVARLRGSNLPKKSNFHGRSGYEAISGKSNFDISEWMLLKHLEWLDGMEGAIGVLCKSSVARKVLFHAWKNGRPVAASSLFKINAKRLFNANVDACFLAIEINSRNRSASCGVYDGLESPRPSQTIGYYGGILLSNTELYRRWESLGNNNKSDGRYVWRSGIKHDSAKIMELKRDGNFFRNGDNIAVDLEREFLYPMLKSSDLENIDSKLGGKYMLVTQRETGENTRYLTRAAPKIWMYLKDNETALKNRASSIYKKRPPFSIFGVGGYSFAPWKVAISGFYKRLIFRVVGPYENKPVVFDDTVNFIPCWLEAEACFIAEILNSKPAKDFYSSMIFWANKRPVTIEILKRLNLRELSVELGREKEYLSIGYQRADLEHGPPDKQLSFGLQINN